MNNTDEKTQQNYFPKAQGLAFHQQGKKKIISEKNGSTVAGVFA